MANQGEAARNMVDPEKQRLLISQHREKHFNAGEVVRDIIIGVSDGLTVPFALAAGLSGANASSSIVLTAGIAEVAAGAISMGLGGYLAAKSEADHYLRELRREQEEIITVPETEAAEVAQILADYGIEPHEYAPVVNALRRKPQAWLDFMMKFELGLEKPDPKRALHSAITIAVAYVLGGILPLTPYFFIPRASEAVVASVVLTLAALLIFGYAKGHFTGNRPFLSAIQTTLIGAVASAAAFGMAKVIKH
ncbi:vacuolar iron transporter 1 [Morus notabilis]|uniref:vacuolar iron transporter 1 n=1 Tax=Morus notabilis TaxID=981085 RepID=UPI000CED5165|nr:vacuolar iron transporter 1 [Morus notabilis]